MLMLQTDDSGICVGDVWKERDPRATEPHALVVGVIEPTGKKVNNRWKVQIIRGSYDAHDKQFSHPIRRTQLKPRLYLADRLKSRWDRVRNARELKTGEIGNIMKLWNPDFIPTNKVEPKDADPADMSLSGEEFNQHMLAMFGTEYAQVEVEGTAHQVVVYNRPEPNEALPYVVCETQNRYDARVIAHMFNRARGLTDSTILVEDDDD